MKLLKTVSQGMDENCYITVNELTNEAMVIDPGAEDYKIKELIDKNELKVKAILLTHCHYDHIESLRAIKDYTGADVYICSGEQVIAESENANLSVYLGGRPLKAEYDIVAEDNDRFEIGGLNFKVIKTPGHTPGGCCFYFEREGVLFSGDTLFFMSRGRTDFPYGDEKQLSESITKKLFSLPEDVTVFPGHGSKTTIGMEKKIQADF